MKLYIAEGRINYESGYIYGVFSTRDKAEKLEGEIREKKVLTSDDFVITEIEVDVVHPSGIVWEDPLRPSYKI